MPDSVSTQVENQRLFAEAYAGAANTALASLLGINTPFTPTLGPPGEVNVVPPTGTLLDPLDYTGRAFQKQPAPNMGALLDVAFPLLPDFPVDRTGAQPTLTLPDKPSQIGKLQAAVPTLDAIPDIDNLDVSALLSGVSPPTISPSTLPAKPTVVLPEYTLTRPGAAPSAPTDLAGQLQSAYLYAQSIMPSSVSNQADSLFRRWFPNHAAGLAALETRLAAYMRGEFEFDDQIADAITELARDQIDAEYVREYREAAEDGAKRGWGVPDAVVLARQAAAGSKRADANARSAMDLRKVRFDYQQKMLEMTIRESKDLRVSAMSVYVNLFQSFAVINGQCIDYSKAILQSIVELFNAQVRAYEATLEGYKAEAAVYEARVKAALALLDVYRAELEAEKLKVDVDLAKVRIYEARLRAVEVYAAVYKTKADVVGIRAGLQRLKFDVYESQIKGYVALVGAKEAEYRGYAAEIAGETALQQAWAESVRARVAELEGFKTHVAALMEELKGRLAYNENIVRQFEANARVYDSLTNAERAAVEADIEIFKAQNAAISEANRALAQQAEMKLKEWEVGKQVVLKRADQSIERARAEALVKIENLRLQIEVASRMGENLSRIAQSALAGLNAVRQVSDNTTRTGASVP